jgi:predicted RNA binding protein YcfA (HicA-like mRNA interferase family)
MPRLVPLKPQEVIRKLKQLGFDGPYPGGRHQRMVNLKSGKVIPVPLHKGRDVSVGLIREIITEVGVSREDWLAL